MGSLLRPALALIYINEITGNSSSQLCLFTDDFDLAMDQ